VVLASTHERALVLIPLQVLEQHSVDVPPIRGILGLVVGTCGERGRPPLARSSQSNPRLTDPLQLHAFAMHGDMMMEPAQGHQTVGIRAAPVRPELAVVDFQTVSR
jgi:hypothetical protein